MRKLLSILVAGVMLGGLFQGCGQRLYRRWMITRFVTTTEFKVPVKNEKVTVVMVGEDTIAVAYSEFPILIPKGIDPQVSYMDVDGIASQKNLSRANGDTFINKVDVGVNKAKLFQVICFEDSRKGDFDYNDLVIHVKYQQRGDIFGLACNR